MRDVIRPRFNLGQTDWVVRSLEGMISVMPVGGYKVPGPRFSFLLTLAWAVSCVYWQCRCFCRTKSRCALADVGSLDTVTLLGLRPHGSHTLTGVYAILARLSSSTAV